MWSKIIKSIILAVFFRRVLWPVLLFLLFLWVVVGIPMTTRIVEANRAAQGICVEHSFKTCPYNKLQIN